MSSPVAKKAKKTYVGEKVGGKKANNRPQNMHIIQPAMRVSSRTVVALRAACYLLRVHSHLLGAALSTNLPADRLVGVHRCGYLGIRIWEARTPCSVALALQTLATARCTCPNFNGQSITLCLWLPGVGSLLAACRHAASQCPLFVVVLVYFCLYPPFQLGDLHA